MHHCGPSLFGIRSGRLALVKLVQPTISLTLLALLAPATVAPRVRIWQWSEGGLRAHSDRLVGAVAGRSLVKVDPRASSARMSRLIDISDVNSKLIRQICEPTRLLLGDLIHIRHLG